MKILNKIFGKEKHEISPEEMKKVKNLVSKNNEQNKEDFIEIEKEEEIKTNLNQKEDKVDYLKVLENIKIEDINKIRNFLDEKENELFNENNDNENQIEKIDEAKNIEQENEKIQIHKEKLENNEELIGGINDKSTSEIKINEHITEKNLDNKTYDELRKTKEEKPLIEQIKFEQTTKENEYNEVKVNDLFEKKESIKFENKTLQTPKEKFEDMLNKIKNIFGEENILFLKNKKSIYENLNYRHLDFIGIRKVDEFKNDIAHWAEQNSWFVNNFKKLEELKQFKIIESKEGIKDLLFDINSENSIILSFRTIDKLKDKNSFDFPISNN